MSFLSFGGSKSIHTILQNEAMECGLACLAMIANYHHHDIGLPYLRSLFQPSRRGMTLAEIVGVAEQLALDAQGLALTSSSDLEKLKCPALLHWNGNHFVVLEKVVRNAFHVHDPAFGLRIYDLEDMERHFSGVALEFEPRIDFVAIKRQNKSRIWEVFKSCRGLEGTIALITLLSFSANLFSLTTPVLLEVAIDDVIPQFDLDLLTIVAIGMALFVSFDAISRWIRDTITLRAATMFETYFTRNVVGHAFRLPLSFFELRHPGDFITRLTSIDHIKGLVAGGFVTAIADGAMSVMLVALMFYYSTPMTIASLLTLAVAIALRLVAYPQIAAHTSASLDARSEEQGRLLDGLKGVAALKAHNATEFFAQRWFDAFGRFTNLSFRTRKLSIDTDLILHIVFMTGTVTTLYMGVTDVMKSVASVGVLYAFFSLRGSFFQSMNALILNLLQISIMKMHFARLDDILDAEPEPGAGKGAINRIVRRTVALENVCVRFSASAKPLVEDIDLTIDVAAGESIAIVGPSGSGKSSILKLIGALDKPSRGHLLIDGQATEVFGLKEYRSNIGAVFADDVLFSGTIAENLALFDPDISMRRIEEALDTVGLLDDVYRLPQGMATLVSQEGALLSTGQRRRLLLARALCRRPRLLLLDEVTANLDMPMEDRMMRSLRALPGAKIFATHSERVLTHMDRVFEIRDGAFLERKFSESAERPPTTADA